MKRNAFLVALSAIFFWAGINMIADFIERLIRDMLFFIDFPDLLILLFVIIIFLSIITFGILKLKNYLLNDNILDINILKISIALFIIGQILMFINPFIYQFYDISKYSQKLNEYIGLKYDIAQFSKTMVSYLILIYIFYKSKNDLMKI